MLKVRLSESKNVLRTLVLRMQVLRTLVLRALGVEWYSSLYNLAKAITQANGFQAYGFYSDHYFGLDDSEDEYNAYRAYELFVDMGKTPLVPSTRGVLSTTTQLWKQPGNTRYFLFDYDQMWYFTVTLKKFRVKERGIKSKGKAPVQYPNWEHNSIEYINA